MQAQKAASSIFRFQKQFGFFRPADAFRLFDSMVKPIAIYGAEIWGYKYSEESEKNQTKFCKRYVGLQQNTADNFALGECGRFPFAVAYMVQPIKYWIKLTQMQNHRYPRQCYLILRSLTDVKSLLFEHGFGYTWIADAVGNTNSFTLNFISIV